MVEQKPVNVGWQVVFCIIPYLWIYGFYRIEKLRMGLVITIVTFLVSVGFQLLLPFPYGLGLSLIFGFIFTIYFMISLSQKWNTKFSSVKQ